MRVFVIMFLMVTSLCEATTCEEIRLGINNAREVLLNSETILAEARQKQMRQSNGMQFGGIASRFSVRESYAWRDAPEARRRIVQLENLAAAQKCNAPFSTTTIVHEPPNMGARKGLTFDKCMVKCRQYTSRDDEQCFDSCNK